MKTFLSISALPTKVLSIYFAYIILFLGEVFWVFDLNYVSSREAKEMKA